MATEDIANSFRRWGYLQADLDPLGNLPKYPHRDIDNQTGAEAEKWRKIYCSKIGAEFMHMPYPDRCDWLASRIENSPYKVDQQQIFSRLLTAERLETFIHSKYIGSKWFSLEGLTSMIPLIDSVLAQCAERGVEIAIIGMAHRGRINMLYHHALQPASSIFACFEDVDPRSVLGSGDTKYHKGATGIFKTSGGKDIRVHLGSNPSHLEAVNPVVMGRARARQMRLKDENGAKVVAILIHGDAAFSGQGVAAECLNYAGIPGFSIGGTIHIIANNLIGFTARPQACFTGHFASDIAKRLAIPIFHVNGESPEDAVRVGQLVSDYRADFQSDVLIDLIGYRRFGHNEMDDPTTTAPVLYEKVKSHPLLHEQYAKQIGIDQADVKAREEKFIAHLKEEQEVARTMTKQPKFATMPEYWAGFEGGYYEERFEVETAVPAERLAQITERIAALPADFSVHPKIKKGYEQRVEMGNGRKAIDWGMAEILAFGSLLWDGVPVRITGQDSRRATFNQRQAVLYDTKTEQEYIPLCHLHANQGWFEIYDSMLSEAGAVGFEYGFSRDYPEALVCWEAQFGDFVNGAQIIIDQFISAGEDKWSLLSGITMLLPHGYEGMGPEHSSARIERFLQLAGEDNIQVVYPSTAAQHFHLLRRQALCKWRKPLIVFTPKSLLRSPLAAAQLSDLTDGGFQNVIDDLVADKQSVERILICSGKIVHELRTEQKKNNHTDTAIVTVEQLYPFPEEHLEAVLAGYPAARVIVWVQEEPANMGPLSYIRPLIERLANGKTVTSVKRSASASPATGSAKAHAMEQEAILKFAFAKFR